MEIKLTALRSKIDSLDATLLKTLASRQKVSRSIGELKRKNGMKMVDYTRFRELLEERMSTAEELELSPTLIKKIFTLIHSASVDEQRKLKK